MPGGIPWTAPTRVRSTHVASAKLQDMVRSYAAKYTKIAQGKELPAATDLFEQVAVELEQGPRHSVDLGVVKRRKLSDLLGTLPANRPFPGKEAVREEVGKALGRPAAPLT